MLPGRVLPVLPGGEKQFPTKKWESAVLDSRVRGCTVARATAEERGAGKAVGCRSVV